MVLMWYLVPMSWDQPKTRHLDNLSMLRGGQDKPHETTQNKQEPKVFADWLRAVCPRQGPARLDPDNRKPLKEHASAEVSEHNNRKQH